MRKLMITVLLTMVGASTVAAQEHSERPTPPRGGWDVHFAILPTADGALAGCRFEAVMNPASGERIPGVAPSESFISAACERLARKSDWLVSIDEDGGIKETYDSCRLTSIHSDRPECRVDEAQ